MTGPAGRPGAPLLRIIAYTDGACSGNPGPGGWGALLQAHRDGAILKERTLCGGDKDTTNNRMELKAAIEALKTLSKPAVVSVRTDSRYVHGGVTKWIRGWKAKRWKLSNGNPVKNVDLWKQLDDLTSRHNVTWEWVKGHACEPGNERADELARQGMAPFLE